MVDMRDIPFRTASAGPSTGQAFRRFGTAGRQATFFDAASDCEAMSARFLVAGKNTAEASLEILRENVIKYILPSTGDFHGYSTGRLAATIGRFDPSKFVGSESGADAEQKAMQWATNSGLGNRITDTADELTIYEYGAYSSVKRYKASTWAVEMGTFTPYAGLVEDGGQMPIYAYGNKGATITARWEANHMFKRGTFDSYKDIEKLMQQETNDVLA
jgi:hypothetical protein